MITRIKRSNAGFTLVELLVVMSIFVIITSIVLYNQNKFSSDISISNAAYEVALDIRQAQVYGTLVREGVGGDFNKAYGTHFERNSDSVIEFSLFSDDNNNRLFDVFDDSILSTNADIGEGNIITKVCTYDTAGSDEECFTAAGAGDITKVDIVFKRPDPAALMTDSLSNTELKGETQIYIQSSLGDKVRIVKVFSSGQISVSDPINI